MRLATIALLLPALASAFPLSRREAAVASGAAALSGASSRLVGATTRLGSTAESGAAKKPRGPQGLAPVGFRAATVSVGGTAVPTALWYPTTDTAAPSSEQQQKLKGPFDYRIDIGKIARALLGFALPIPNKRAFLGDPAEVLAGAAPALGAVRGGVIFAHGMLGSRFDECELCSALARRGFVVGAADFAESISGSFEPTEATTRGAIVAAVEELVRAEYTATSGGGGGGAAVLPLGIMGHSAGGGTATTAPGPYALGRVAIAGARPYEGPDPLLLIASEGDGVIPLARVRDAAPRAARVVARAEDLVGWRDAPQQAWLIEEPLGGMEHTPNHISFLSPAATEVMTDYLSPFIPLAKLLRLPTLDFATYATRRDAAPTAAATHGAVVAFFEGGRAAAAAPAPAP